jgi:twinkle protein
MDSYSYFGITIPQNKTTGQVQTICPKCSHTRKKKTDKCLGVNLDKKVWNCVHCNWKGRLKENSIMDHKIYVKPVWKNKTDLSDKVIKYFESRKINQQTLIDLKITESNEFFPQLNSNHDCINFNYFNENNELINVKYRGPNKSFKLHKDAKLIMYNLNNVNFKERVYIVEGEIDALTLIQCGFKNTLSVPNGASTGANNLSYFDEVADLMFETPEIYLATDNDLAGRNLREQLADRIGKERCKIVEFKNSKDSNDCLVNYDLQTVIESISIAKEFPLEGVFTINQISDEIDDLYENGLDKGVDLKIDGFNLNIVKGYLSIITGIPSHGKSEWLDNMCVHLRKNHNWNGAFYSPENRPSQLHFSKMARKLIGKNWDGPNRMSKYEVDLVKKYLDNKFFFIKPEKDFTLDSILNHCKQLKYRKGLDFFVIDAWNKLEHKGDGNSNDIGKALDKLVQFCEINNVHCFLVAHPTKMKKTDGKNFDVPTLYDINGSSNFYNKADNGICVYRDKEQGIAYVIIQKVKFSHWGEESTVSYAYERDSTRYYKVTPDFSNWISEPKEQYTLQQNNDFLTQKDLIISNLDNPF